MLCVAAAIEVQDDMYKRVFVASMKANLSISCNDHICYDSTVLGSLYPNLVLRGWSARYVPTHRLHTANAVRLFNIHIFITTDHWV